MKAQSIIAAILLTIGLLVCFSAAGSMDAGASWVEGAIRGTIGIIFMSVAAVLSKDTKFYESTDARSECVEYCEADVIATQAVYEFLKETGVSEQEDIS